MISASSWPLLRDIRDQRIVVEHRERLPRFGVHELEHALAACGRHVRVVDDKEVDNDLVGDMIDGITSLAARRYGRRSAPQRAGQAVIAIDAKT